MTKINIDYAKKLFEYVEKNGTVHAPHTIKPSELYDEVHKGLGPFLDTVCVYADSLDIEETVVTEQYTENRYYYNIKCGRTVLEIGTYYDYDSIYVKEAGPYDEEFVINCEDMFKEKKKGTKTGTKVLSFESQEVKPKKEDK